MRVIVYLICRHWEGTQEMFMNMCISTRVRCITGNVFYGVRCRPMLRENHPFQYKLWPRPDTPHVICSTLGEAVSQGSCGKTVPHDAGGSARPGTRIENASHPSSRGLVAPTRTDICSTGLSWCHFTEPGPNLTNDTSPHRHRTVGSRDMVS